jgi:hypothetical protein
MMVAGSPSRARSRDLNIDMRRSVARPDSPPSIDPGQAPAGEVFGDNNVATAMIDRLVHHAEVIVVKGDSYRFRNRDLGRVPAGNGAEDTRKRAGGRPSTDMGVSSPSRSIDVKATSNPHDMLADRTSR